MVWVRNIVMIVIVVIPRRLSAAVGAGVVCMVAFWGI